MTLYVLSYDLIKFKDYPKLWDALKKAGAFRVLESVWLLTSDKTAKQVYDWFSAYIDADDRLLVAATKREQLHYRAKTGTNAWLDRNAA